MGKETMRDKLEEVILASYESMYRMAFVYMKNESDALDVVQESVVKAIKSSPAERGILYENMAVSDRNQYCP